MLRFLSILFLSLLFLQAQSQEEVDSNTVEYVQFSGVVVTGSNLDPVPYVNILEKTTWRGTSSDYYGFFSFVAQPGDTIVFTSIGYKPSQYIIPEDLEKARYSLIHKITEDTVLLKVKEVFPWPSREQFKEAFLTMDIPNDDLRRAQANLDPEVLAYKSAAYPRSGSVNFKAQMQQISTQLYYAGQAPPNNLLNPIAWANFIKAWKRGDFRKQE